MFILGDGLKTNFEDYSVGENSTSSILTENFKNYYIRIYRILLLNKHIPLHFPVVDIHTHSSNYIMVR